MTNRSTDAVAAQRALAGASAVRPTRVRYGILGLTFLVAFVMYIDRACMGTASPYIMKEFGIDKIQMGWSASAFNLAYSIFQVPGGWLTDRFGARIVLAVAITWWSLFTAATGLAFSAISLGVTRFLFGMGEAAAFPASSRAVLPWLPAAQRAFGQGFQHSGSRLGAALAPLAVVALIPVAGWRGVFYLFGAIGLVLAIVWYAWFRDYPNDHARVNPEELELLKASGISGKPKSKRAVPWRRILSSRDVWYLSTMYFCYGWVLWLYIQWLPTYLVEHRNFSQIKMGLGASLPLLAATVSNVLGGWFSDTVALATGNLRRGRLLVALLGFGIAGLVLIPAAAADSASTALACLTIALAALELTVAVSWAIALDLGRDFSGSVSGVMNTLGNLGGTLGAVSIGYISTLLGWTWVFGAASAMCLLAGLIATLIDPRRAITGSSASS
jgi:MFS transporter, ACS family, glucarate transporter